MKQVASISADTLKAFEVLPDLYLIISPELTILAASNAYLKATLKKRDAITGRYLFDIFPDNPILPFSDSTENLKSSLQWVLEHKQVHTMKLQRYDVVQPEIPGSFVEKYWLPSNTPVLDDAGDVLYIIHRVEDETQKVMMQQRIDIHELQVEKLMEEKSEESANEMVVVRAEAELERRKLYNFFMEAPAMICIFEGPEHTFKMANPAYQQLVGERPILGKPILEAMPELKGQSIKKLLDRVYQTGESFHAYEMMVQLDHENKGELGNNYYNFTYQATHDLDGNIEGILVFAYDVTTQVEARQKIEQREKDLQLLNRALARTQQELKELNQKLEERIAARTEELQLSKLEIEKQRNRLQKLFMEATAPICILSGEDFVFELVNPAYQALLPGRELLGKSMLGEALSELADAPFAQALRQVYHTGETVEVTEELVPVSSYEGAPLENRYFNYTLQARQNEQGQIDGIIIFVYEVSSLVEARQLAEQNAKRLRLITDSLPVLIGYLDKEVRYQFTNKAYEAWFPTKAEDLIGRYVRDVVGDAAYNGVKHYIDRALAGERLDFKSRMPYREDFVKHIHTSYIPDIQEGEVKGFYTLVADITEQEQAREKLEKSQKEALEMTENLKLINKELSIANRAFLKLTQRQQLLVALVENSTDFIGLTNPDGNGVYLNKAGLALVGLERQQFRRRNMLEFFIPEDRVKVEQEVLPAAKEKGHWEGELHLQHFQTGQQIPVHYSCFSIRNPETDELLALATITTNITERKKQESRLKALTNELAATNKELLSSNEQLQRTNIDLDNFIYTASHDLKAPISNIEGLMLILFDSLPDEVLANGDLPQVKEMIEDSIARFQRTIHHLTEVIKLQKENTQEQVMVSIAHVVQDVKLDLSAQLEEAQAKLDIDLDNCPRIRFSEKNLRSVVYNLISNAVKYRSPDRLPEISITCRPEDSYTVLTVQDNGLGMDLKGRNKLFVMFGRLHDHVEGTGIGLYMVKRMIENAEGRIEVESTEGVGSTFKVYFKNW